jgi:hypothetical protein
MIRATRSTPTSPVFCAAFLPGRLRRCPARPVYPAPERFLRELVPILGTGILTGPADFTVGAVELNQPVSLDPLDPVAARVGQRSGENCVQLAHRVGEQNARQKMTTNEARFMKPPCAAQSALPAVGWNRNSGRTCLRLSAAGAVSRLMLVAGGDPARGPIVGGIQLATSRFLRRSHASNKSHSAKLSAFVRPASHIGTSRCPSAADVRPSVI